MIVPSSSSLNPMKDGRVKAVSIGSSWRPKGVMLGAIAKMEWRIFSSRFPKGGPHICEYVVGPRGPVSVFGFTVSSDRILVPCSDQGLKKV